MLTYQKNKGPFKALYANYMDSKN